MTAGARALRVVKASGQAGGSLIVPIEMAAIGDENAVGFSLHFDPARLSFASVVLGSGADDSTLILNTNQTTGGEIGVLLAKGAGQAFSAGPLELLDFSFVSGATGGEPEITFADTPVLRQIGDATANELPATFTDSVITIGSPVADDPTDGRAPSILNLSLPSPLTEIGPSRSPGKREQVEGISSNIRMIWLKSHGRSWSK